MHREDLTEGNYKAEGLERLKNDMASLIENECGVKNGRCLVDHLYAQGVLNKRDIIGYTVRGYFGKALRDNGGRVTYAFKDLAVKYGVHEETIKSWYYYDHAKIKKIRGG